MGEPLNFVAGGEKLCKKYFEGAIGNFVHAGESIIALAGIAGGDNYLL